MSAYVEATAGLDARREISILRRLVGDGARVLELGSGGGVDLLRLSRHFDVLGSDPSAAARRWIARRTADAVPVIDLHAQDLDLLTDRLAGSGTVPIDWPDTLGAIFSVKVLHLLDPEAHRRCIAAQARLLAPHGVALHLYWAPASPEHAAAEGPRLDAEELRRLWRRHFHEVEVTPRSELAHHDLLRVTARHPTSRIATPPGVS